MALYDVPAPAKLNLFLHVIGRRPDGYHELQTVFRFIDLCDTLDFDVRRDGLIARDAQGLPGLAPEEDLVVRAARSLQQATGTGLGAQIRYTKRIPSGAGLGGGSSDAATTLIALNRLWGTGLDRKALMELARPLGADVPVFIFGASSFAEGIGDVLTEVTLPERAYLVLRPHGSVATANVFSSPNLTRDTKPVKISFFADWQTGKAHKQTSIQAGEKARFSGNDLFGRNDLEPVVRSEYESVGRMASSLQELNFHVRMTGSGSCFFIEYDSIETATRAKQEISSKILGGSSEEQSRRHGAGAPHQSPVAVVENSWACPGLFEHPLRHW